MYAALPPIFGPVVCAEEKQTRRSFNNRTGWWVLKCSQSVSHISSWLGLPNYFKHIHSLRRGRQDSWDLRKIKEQKLKWTIQSQVTFLEQKATELVSPHQNIRQYNTRSVLWQVNPTWMFTSLDRQDTQHTQFRKYPTREATVSKTTPACNWLQQLQGRTWIRMEKRN